MDHSNDLTFQAISCIYTIHPQKPKKTIESCHAVLKMGEERLIAAGRGA